MDKPSNSGNAIAARKANKAMEDLHAALNDLRRGSGEDPDLGQLLSDQYVLSSKIYKYTEETK